MNNPEHTTVSGARVIVVQPDGTETNITEGVETLYDLTRNSMDWGSGFIPIEQMDVVLNLAITCGFPDAEKLAKEVREAVAKKTYRIPSEPEEE
jgi:hypothetical protein